MRTLWVLNAKTRPKKVKKKENVRGKFDFHKGRQKSLRARSYFSGMSYWGKKGRLKLCIKRSLRPEADVSVTTTKRAHNSKSENKTYCDCAKGVVPSATKSM